MSYYATTSGPGAVGLQPDHLVRRCKTEEALVKGQLVVLDFLDASLSKDPNDGTASKFGVVRLPDTGVAPVMGLEHSIYGVAQDIAAANAEVDILFYGITDALFHEIIEEGEAAMADTDGELVNITGVSGQKVIALTLEDSVADAISSVFFNGFGWGQDG